MPDGALVGLRVGIRWLAVRVRGRRPVGQRRRGIAVHPLLPGVLVPQRIAARHSPVHRLLRLLLLTGGAVSGVLTLPLVDDKVAVRPVPDLRHGRDGGGGGRGRGLLALLVRLPDGRVDRAAVGGVRREHGVGGELRREGADLGLVSVGVAAAIR